MRIILPAGLKGYVRTTILGVFGNVGPHPAKAQKLSMTQQIAFISSYPLLPKYTRFDQPFKNFFRFTRGSKGGMKNTPKRFLDKPFPIRYKLPRGGISSVLNRYEA
jgi:hypothetical protein